MSRPRLLIERFEEKVERPVDVHGCWLWKASLNIGGYGRINCGARRSQMAHRVAYELFIGPIPPGFNVCHRCDVPRCVNPAHLFLGMQADNVADMVAKGRAAQGPRGRPLSRALQTHCKRGHEFPPENTRLRRNGNRCCRECDRFHARASWQRRRAA